MIISFYTSLDPTIFIFIIPFALLANFYLGNLIARMAYKPIRKLIENMNKITLDDTSHKVQPEGNENDESFQLAVKYNSMLDRVNEASDKQKQFIANASHELKSPIARAVGSLDILKVDVKKEKPELLDKISNIQSELIELADVINNMLVLSRLKEKSKETNIFNPHEIITDITNKYSDQKVLIDINKDISIKFQRDIFKQMISNLLENAVKYGQKGSIKIRSVALDKQLSISISNKVLQTSKAKKRNMFKRFSKKINKDTNSFGLGLSIIKNIVEDSMLDIDIKEEKNIFEVTVKGFRLV